VTVCHTHPGAAFGKGWDTPAQSDHERPLNQCGKQAAKALGNWFRRQGWHPDQVRSSDSERTKQAFAGLGLKTGVMFTNDLYHASEDQMLRILSRATGDVVLMLGQVTGIAAFAAKLAHEAPENGRFFDYPSGATLVLRFDTDTWSTGT